MYRNRKTDRRRMMTSPWLTNVGFIALMLLGLTTTARAQETQREQPVWWYGAAAAVNLNFYSGTTQTLNGAFVTPAAFHKGFGPGLYLAPLVEYRPDSVWGGILQVGFDDRRGAFDDVPCPCGENSTLSANISYISIEPSLRIAPFSNEWYVFGGPRFGFNWAPTSGYEKEFLYTQEGQTATQGNFSSMNGMVYSAQIGIGYDIALSEPNAPRQVNISPFISYQPYFGQDPRSIDNWGVSTVRVGAQIKFGSGAVIPQKAAPVPVVEGDVQFSVRAPKAVPVKRRVRETFPLRNYIFFDLGSEEIPDRYIRLTKSEASNFKEEQLQDFQPKSFVGRSARQMVVYYNTLNIVGDRMKRSPSTSINLSGASSDNPAQGKARAETVKKYLVDVFGIVESRIKTEGRDRPKLAEELRGATRELALLKEGDRRVDIESTSPELTMEVGGPAHYMLKPVQVIVTEEDPLDSHILFHVEGATEVLASWSLEISDEQGKIQRFGPSTREDENISGNAVLGDRSRGEYKVVMLGQTKGGRFVRKEAPLRLVRRVEPVNDVVRYVILFDFDESQSVASYEKFLTEVLSPLIPDSSLVIIHGYTDPVGEAEYNENLSRERVENVRGIIEASLSKRNSRGVRYETFGFGEDLLYARFDNYFPEGRFYNRSVVIDIVPD